MIVYKSDLYNIHNMFVLYCIWVVSLPENERSRDSITDGYKFTYTTSVRHH